MIKVVNKFSFLLLSCFTAQKLMHLGSNIIFFLLSNSVKWKIHVIFLSLNFLLEFLFLSSFHSLSQIVNVLKSVRRFFYTVFFFLLLQAVCVFLLLLTQVSLLL